jgi:hypothetical protein
MRSWLGSEPSDQHGRIVLVDHDEHLLPVVPVKAAREVEARAVVEGPTCCPHQDLAVAARPQPAQLLALKRDLVFAVERPDPRRPARREVVSLDSQEQ